MKVLFVDLSAVFWRAYHATKDQQVNECFSITVNTINSRRHGYDHCAICCDHPPYKRKQISQEYKAQRDVPDPIAVGQLRRVKERLEADGLLLWDAEGYESDDLIATACEALQHDAGDESDLAIDILTADKDLMALVNERVTVVHLSDGSRFTPVEVETKMGVPPALVSQLLALTGDKSDNVPGCPGVGPKKAAQLLADNDGLTNLLDLLGGNGAVIAQAATLANLKQNLSQVSMSWRLVTLMTDAPIDITQLYERRDPKSLTTEIDDKEFAMSEPESTPENETPLPPVDYEGSPGRLNAAIEVVKPAQQTEAIAQAQSLPFETSLEPRTVQQAWALSKAIHNSRLFACESPDQALMILMTGRELGISAMASLRGFYFVKGRPVMSSQLMAGLILKSGRAEYFECVESGPKSATYATKRKGGSGNEQRKTFTIDDAKLAQLIKADGNWQKYPTNMCEARAAAFLARLVYPDVIMGVYTPGELDDD
jgi:5'-3' exonuclease